MISTWASWASAFAISVSYQYAVLRLPGTAPGLMSTSIPWKTSAARLRAPVVDQATAQGSVVR
jgi:hypothetical protein